MLAKFTVTRKSKEAYPRLSRPATVLTPISKSTFGWIMKSPSLIGLTIKWARSQKIQNINLK